MSIRFLDPTLVSQIAAGEVVERPASAIKELVENSIDAGSTRIDVHLRDGGKTYLCIVDNGKGMSPQDLNLCVERHATSKIPDNDLFNIQTLGFRGEALPSIGSISRLKITTRLLKSETAWEMNVEGGIKSGMVPASGSYGTRIEVRDLFYAMLARLKFLKTAATELSHIVDIIERLALINPSLEFNLTEGERRILSLTKARDRIQDILGKDFHENSSPLNCQHQDFILQGRISIPIYHHSSLANQYFFINNRPVKDRLLGAAIRVAYQDVLPTHRYPSLCLFLQCPPDEVDINVHPTKAEVRFRTPNLIRGFVIKSIRESFKKISPQNSPILSSALAQAFTLPLPHSGRELDAGSKTPFMIQPRLSISSQNRDLHSFNEQLLTPFHKPDLVATLPSPPLEDSRELGSAKAQIHDTYIIAETKEYLVIVDQHAAHERLIYEKMKQDMENGLIKRQSLLIPEIIHLTVSNLDLIKPYFQSLNDLGFSIEGLEETGIIIREVPVFLIQCNLKQLMEDLVAEIKSQDTGEIIKQTLHEILANKACKNSIRAGHKLSLEEMNGLLRQMELTPSSSQCNHGRPTFVTLDRQALEKLFGRRG